MTLAIPPVSATNKLKIDVIGHWGSSSASQILGVALFQDSTAGALAASGLTFSVTNGKENIAFTHYMTAGTTALTTFKIRAGTSVSSTVTFNGSNGARVFGGVIASSITITEVQT